MLLVPLALLALAVGASNFSFTGTTLAAKAGDVLPVSTDWGLTTTWATTPTATVATGNSMYMVTGLYYPAANETIWYGPPFLAYLKVGSLSAISANMGTITAGTITSGTTGQDRLIVTPGLITIYNAANELVMEMGVLP